MPPSSSSSYYSSSFYYLPCIFSAVFLFVFTVVFWYFHNIKLYTLRAPRRGPNCGLRLEAWRMGGRLWPDFSSRTCQLLPVIRHPVVPEASTDGHVPAFRSVSFISFPTSTFSMSAACCPIAFTPAFFMTVAPFSEVWWRLEIVSFFLCYPPFQKFPVDTTS